MILADDRLAEGGVAPEPLAELGDDVLGGSVGVAGRLEGLVFDGLDLVGGRRRQRRRARGAETLRPSQRRVAARALLEVGGRRLAPVLALDVVVIEDVVVELLVTDGVVDADHVGVDLPACAVLDGLLGETLADPVRDRGVAEVVQVALLPVDAGVVGDLLDAVGEVLVGERTVVLAVPVAGVLVEDGRVLVVAAGMDVEVVGQLRLAPGERDGPGGVLDVGLLVDRDQRRPAGQVEIPDPEAGDRADPEAGVGQERDQRLVAGLRRRVQERLDLVVGQQVVGIDLAVGRDTDDEVLDPVGAVPAVELLERLAVVPARPFGEAVVVLEVEQQRVDVLAIHLDQRDVRPLGGESDPVQEVDDRPAVALAVGVQVADPVVDRLPIALVDGGVVDLCELVLELPAVVLDVVDVGHSTLQETMDYQTCSQHPGWTTKNSYIVHNGQQRPSGRSNPWSGQRNDESYPAIERFDSSRSQGVIA